MSIARLSPRLPTSTDDWQLMGRTARLVLGSPVYAALALGTALVALSAFVLGQNFELTRFALSGTLGFEDATTVLLGLYPFLGTNYAPVAEVLLVAVSGLTGVDVAMVVYHFREHGVGSGGDGATTGGSGAIGVVLGALGTGCAACGSAILAGLLSLFGVAGAGTLLPLDGLEFSLLALVALLLSIYWVADGMRGGEIRGCPI
jgi:hypothetical protein